MCDSNDMQAAAAAAVAPSVADDAKRRQIASDIQLRVGRAVWSYHACTNSTANTDR